MDQKKIGKFLQELRKEKGLTQEQVAAQFNTTNRTISRWETGSNTPDISLLVEIAEFYGVDVREIIDGERKKENMEREVREVAVKMADYAGQEKNNILKFVRRISIASVVISGILLARHLFGMLRSAEFGWGGALLLFLLFVFSCITSFYTNGKLNAVNKKTITQTAIKIALTLFICVIGLGCFYAFIILGSVASFSLNPFNRKKAEGIEEYDKSAILEKYGSDLSTALYLFPDNADKTEDAEYEAYFSYGLLDTDSYMVLEATYSAEEFDIEVQRLADISCSTAYDGETYTQDVVYDTDSYLYPAYVAVDGYASEYEYALINESQHKITYIYFTYSDSILKHIDAEYRKVSEDAYTFQGSTLERPNIYYHYDPDEGMAVSDVA